MALSLSECEMVVEELCPALSKGWIQKIHQPNLFTLTFDIHVPGATLTLFVTVEPRLARVHLTSRKFQNPPSPPPFCQYLRSQVEGGRIEEMTQEVGDRIMYVKIVKGEKGYYLVISLTGNHANVLLLDDKKILLRSLKDWGGKVGEPYFPPIKKTLSSQRSSDNMPKGKNPSTIPMDVSSKRTQIDLSSVRSGKKVQTHEKGKAGKQLSLSPPHGEKSLIDRFPVSFHLDKHYSQKEEDIHLASLLQQQRSQLQKGLKQARLKAQALDEDLKKADRYREYARYGELLKSSLLDIKKGQETITTVDYFDPTLPTITLPLDPTKDPVGNMEDYFRKYRKFLGTQEHLVPRM